MGKKAGKKNGGGGSSAGGGGGFSTIDVDPRLVRYAHSKIKPLFSGCGRTIEQTLREIRDGRTRASDLPMITVLLGSPDPSSDGGQQRSFFSLNNRRLFVFKACQEEGLLGPSGLVRVRARPMKAHERERYTVERCSLQAKFLFELKPTSRSPSELAAVGTSSSLSMSTAAPAEMEEAPTTSTEESAAMGEVAAAEGEAAASEASAATEIATAVDAQDARHEEKDEEDEGQVQERRRSSVTTQGIANYPTRR